jgi:hypothetical protein
MTNGFSQLRQFPAVLTDLHVHRCLAGRRGPHIDGHCTTVSRSTIRG